MNSFVEITGVEKKIDDFNLGPINLNIEPGTITTLVGNNSSGKSTLLKLMMDLARPNVGEIQLFGKHVNGIDETWKVNVGYQPQTIIGYDPFTGNQLNKLVSHWYPNWDQKLFLNMVALFNVPLNKSFNKLSQGNQQKLILALTIPRNASLLILDEPTSFLDIPSKKILIDLLVDWMDSGERAIITASHQMEDIMKLSDYLVVLKSGQMVGEFEKESLIERYQRYWISDPLPDQIPGEVDRDHQTIISNQPDLTESFLKENNMEWSNHTAVKLDDIITLLLESNS